MVGSVERVRPLQQWGAVGEEGQSVQQEGMRLGSRRATACAGNGLLLHLQSMHCRCLQVLVR